MKFRIIALLTSCAATCASVNADPLAEFEKIVDNCKQAHASRPNPDVVFAVAAKSWVKRVYAKTEISYDVNRSTSLVSPLTAFIHVVDGSAALRAPDEAAATALEPSLDAGTFVMRTKLNFGYQGKKWELVSSVMSSTFKGLEGPVVTSTAAEMQGTRGAISRCLG